MAHRRYLSALPDASFPKRQSFDLRPARQRDAGHAPLDEATRGYLAALVISTLRVSGSPPGPFLFVESRQGATMAVAVGDDPVNDNHSLDV